MMFNERGTNEREVKARIVAADKDIRLSAILWNKESGKEQNVKYMKL